jgi:microcompartment protein CcmK/EutM
VTDATTWETVMVRVSVAVEVRVVVASGVARARRGKSSTAEMVERCIVGLIDRRIGLFGLYC